MPTDQRLTSSMVAAFLEFRSLLSEEVQGADSEFQTGVEFLDVGDRGLVVRNAGTRNSLERLRQKLQKPQWTAKWSATRLENELRRTIGSALSLHDETEITGEFGKLAARLDAPAPHLTVNYPIDGLTLEHTSDVRIGGVRLFTLNSEAMLTELRSDSGEPASETLECQQLKALNAMVCAELVVEGDAERARVEADKLAEPVVDFIQMLVALNEPTATRIRIAPRSRNDMLLPLLVYDRVDKRVQPDRTLLPPSRYNLDALSIERARQLGFGALIESLAKSALERSEFENLLVQALHWIADAERQLQYESKLTSYVTALDMFFTAQNSPIVRDVSEGVAYVMSSTPRGRSELRALVARLYNRRSKVSHEGQRDIGQMEIGQVRKMVIVFFGRLSSMAARFNSRADLNSWLGELRLSGRYDDIASA